LHVESFSGTDARSAVIVSDAEFKKRNSRMMKTRSTEFHFGAVAKELLDNDAPMVNK
jgi:hypothetical protein